MERTKQEKIRRVIRHLIGLQVETQRLGLNDATINIARVLYALFLEQGL